MLRARSSLRDGDLRAAVLTIATTHAPNAGRWTQAAELTTANSAAIDGCPFSTRDGQRLFLAWTRPGGFGGIDIWVAERQTSAPHRALPRTSARESTANTASSAAPRDRPATSCSCQIGPAGAAAQTSTSPASSTPTVGGRRRTSAARSTAPPTRPDRRARYALQFSSTRSGNSGIYASLALGR
jgi:hypothetical protein